MVRDREHDLDGQVLASVVLADVEDAGLGQVVVRVVRDAHADQVASFEGLAERDDVHELRICRRERLEVGDHLR